MKKRCFISLFMGCMVMVMMVFQMPLNVMAVVNAATKITHSPIETFVPGKRVQILAKISDDAGIDVVRCYFKTPAEENYVFVPMSLNADGKYEGILPAPSDATETIQYILLAVNGNNQVVKTQEFSAAKGEKSDAEGGAAYADTLQVYSEVSAEAAPQGFSDSIAMDLVESGARFGLVVGGLYAVNAAAGAGTTGAAASAVSAGSVAAGAGVSTTALVVGGVVTAAAVAGGAAAAGSDGGDKDEPVTVDGTVTKTDVNICVIDSNTWQDEYFDLYVNNVFVGPVNNPPGGTTCYPVVLKLGYNTIELRITNSAISNTGLTISVNDGEFQKTFNGDDQSYSWTIFVSE